MLLGKTQISAISGARRIRVLIASGNPERIMLVRESLHAWPETVVCRVAVSREDAVNQFESHAPHVVCWDTGLGTDVPAVARGISTLLLGEESCMLPEERPWEMALPDAYIAGLQHLDQSRVRTPALPGATTRCARQRDPQPPALESRDRRNRRARQRGPCALRQPSGLRDAQRRLRGAPRRALRPPDP